MSKSIVICDHKVLNASLIPPDMLGSPGKCPRGIYETILWDNGQFIDLEAHLSRYRSGCEYLGIARADAQNISKVPMLEKLVFANELQDTKTRLRIMAFLEPQKFCDDTRETFRFLGAAWPVSPSTSQNPLRCTVSPLRRKKGDTSFAHKLLGRLDVEKELEIARSNGFDDVLFLNDHDELCEAAYANVFLIRNDELFTPPIISPCLPGTIRARIIAVAREHGFKIRAEHPVTKKNIINAQAIFLTSSIRGLAPIAQIDDIWKAETTNAIATGNVFNNQTIR